MPNAVKQDDRPQRIRIVVAHWAEKCVQRRRTLAAIVDAEPTARGERTKRLRVKVVMNLLPRHVHGAGDQHKRRERHGRRQQRGQRDSEDGVVLDPQVTRARILGGTCFSRKLQAAGLAGGVGEKASHGRASGSDEDQQEDVLMRGGVEDQHDVGDAGDGQRHEGAVHDRDEEESGEAEVEEEVRERVWCVGRARKRGEMEGGA